VAAAFELAVIGLDRMVGVLLDVQLLHIAVGWAFGVELRVESPLSGAFLVWTVAGTIPGHSLRR
jgi:hypothetical protein